MANTTIPNLPPAISLDGTELWELVQNGVSRRATTQQLVNLASTGAGTVTLINTAGALTGGPITSSGTISLAANAITNQYLAPMGPGTLKGNLTGSTADPQDVTVNAVLDSIGATPGSMLYRGAGAWTLVPPGTTGQYLTTSGAVPQWGTLSVGPSSLTPTGVSAGTYGTASAIPQFTVLASGQLSAAGNLPIQISTSQVTGLGTMATQNATAVAITGGTMNGVTIGGGAPADASFTNILAGTWLGTAIGVAYGGTGATTASGARSNLGAAASGAVGSSGITMDTARLLGRSTAGSGPIEEITIGANLTLSGGVLSATGGGGGSGTVTSIDVSGGTTGLTTSGGPVTTSGTITLAGTLGTANGGTGLSAWTAGDLPFYATGTALSKLAIGAANTVLISSGTAPQWSTSLTMAGTVSATKLIPTGGTVTGNGLWLPSANVVGLSTAGIDVFRTSILSSNPRLGVGAGGTGQFAFNDWGNDQAVLQAGLVALSTYQGSSGDGGVLNNLYSRTAGFRRRISSGYAHLISFDQFRMFFGVYGTDSANTDATSPGSMTLYRKSADVADLILSGGLMIGSLNQVQPTSAITFGNGTDSDRIISVVRGSGAASESNIRLTMQAGATGSGATNAVGGNLVLNSGIATGNATSDIIFGVAGGGASGTADQAPAERARLTTTGLGIGISAPTAGLHNVGTTILNGAVTLPALTASTVLTLNASNQVTASPSLSVALGGTGQTSYTNGELLIGNSTGNTLTKATLTAGSGISITNGAGSITISATGGGTGTVTSVDVSGGTTGLTTSGGPVTTSGTITLAGTLAVANGGTGATTAGGALTNLGAAASGAVGSSGLTMSTARLLGRTTAATGAIEEITVGSGLTLSGGTLTATGGGTGTVTSVDVSGGTTGLTTSGGPVTTSGTITLAGTLAVTNGGTGATTASNARTNLDAQKTITSGTAAPTGGVDGDIYLQYT